MSGMAPETGITTEKVYGWLLRNPTPLPGSCGRFGGGPESARRSPYFPRARISARDFRVPTRRSRMRIACASARR